MTVRKHLQKKNRKNAAEVVFIYLLIIIIYYYFVFIFFFLTNLKKNVIWQGVHKLLHNTICGLGRVNCTDLECN